MVDESNFQDLKDKIDQLNKQAWDNRVNDSTQAHVLSKEAFELAESIDYPKGKAQGYLTFAFSLIRLSKHHEAIEYLDKALVLFELLHDLEGQSSTYAYYGMIERSFGNYAASLEFLFKYLRFTQQTGNKEQESMGYYHLGVTYKYSGDNERALNYLLQSLSSGRSDSNIYWVSQSYSLKQIGLIYFETADFDNALKYYQQSLPFMQQAGDEWGEAGCLDSIGFCYFEMKQHENAIEFCSQALSISESADDKKGQSNALYHLGNIYAGLDNFNKASEYCDRCLIIRREIEDKKGVAEILLFLAALYLKENRGKDSEQKVFDLLEEALQLGEEIKANDLLSKIHSGYYEACKHFHRYPEALEHIESYINLSKKIDSDAVNEKIKNLEISLKAAETDKKLVIALQENQQIVEVERSRLAKDLHDGMGGLLSGIKLTLNSVADKVPEKNTLLFNKANNQLDTAIREMRRMAHNMMPEALLKFGLGEAIQDFCDGINESNVVKMKYTQIGSLQNLTQPVEIVLYRIVQELTNNALKHAAAKNIFVQITKHPRGVTVTVEDDGCGFDTDAVLSGEGQGIKNVQSRIEYLKGSIDIRSEKENGTSVNIEIPV
jgi:signal transduction histidine kinase